MTPGRATHKGQKRYGSLQKAYGEAYKKLSAAEKAQFGGYNPWRLSDAGREVKRQFDINWQRENRADTTDSGRHTEPQPGPSNAPDDSSFDLDDLFNEHLDYFFNPSDMADVQNNVPEMPTASSVAAGGSDQEPMDTSGLGPNRGGPGGSSLATSSGGSGLAMIMPNPRLKKMHITLSKKWFHYTYGYAHTNVEGTSLTRVLTPYAYYPVDWLPWYLSPQEYTSLPWNSKVVNVKCDIHLIGTRTAFDHGTTLSGTATTEYVPIIKWCVGLNNKVYIDNRPLKSDATEPMKPTGVKDKSLAEQFNTMYQNAGSNEIPRHLNWYAGILYNKVDAEYDGLPTIVNYRLDKVLKTGLANKCMQEAIVNYSYQPANGYIKPTKKVVLPMYNKKDGFADDVNYKQVLYKHQIPHTLKLTATADARGTVKASQNLDATSYDYVNRTSYNYYQSVEGYTYVHVHSGEHSSFRNQPQVHVGLLATPALNPATELSNFLNSSVYTVSYASCDIEFDMESMCTSGDPYDWPEDVKFFINKEKGFQGYGPQIFGVSATTDGRLETPRRNGRKPGTGGTAEFPRHVRYAGHRDGSPSIHSQRHEGGIKRGRIDKLAKRLRNVDVRNVNLGHGERNLPEMLASCESDPDIDIYSYESLEGFESN